MSTEIGRMPKVYKDPMQLDKREVLIAAMMDAEMAEFVRPSLTSAIFDPNVPVVYEHELTIRKPKFRRYTVSPMGHVNKEKH